MLVYLQADGQPVDRSAWFQNDPYEPALKARESDPDRLVHLVRKHIEELGYLVVDGMPGEDERRTHGRIVSFASRFSCAAFRSDFTAPPE